MKKFLATVLALFTLSIPTGCSGTLGQSESEDYNQEVADATESMLADYYEGLREADFDMTFKNYAQFYVDNVEMELEYYGGTTDEYISADNATYYNDNFGEDATITPEVTATTLMTKAVTKKYNKLLKTLYMDDTTTIQNVYTVYVNKIVSGSLKTETEEQMWTILEIDDQYYLYDDYFENMVDALRSAET